jgi:hypothetical protein
MSMEVAWWRVETFQRFDRDGGVPKWHGQGPPSANLHSILKDWLNCSLPPNPPHIIFPTIKSLILSGSDTHYSLSLMA